MLGDGAFPAEFPSQTEREAIGQRATEGASKQRLSDTSRALQKNLPTPALNSRKMSPPQKDETVHRSGKLLLLLALLKERELSFKLVYCGKAKGGKVKEVVEGGMDDHVQQQQHGQRPKSFD